MKKWLVRTHSNLILGPLTEAHVKDQIETGLLKREDEICREDSYWFYLHEREELYKHLLIHLPKTLDAQGGETTLSDLEDTQVSERKTELSFASSQNSVEPILGFDAILFWQAVGWVLFFGFLFFAGLTLLKMRAV